MHVRVRLFGKPDTIVVVESKLTKIDQFRRIIKDKFNVEPKLQRLFYGGKLLDDGYTFHDYNIKLNDVIQLMVQQQLQAPDTANDTLEKQESEVNDNKIDKEAIYTDAESPLYAIGDFIDMRDREQGAWFEGKIVRIVRDPKAPIQTKSETINIKQSTEVESDSENKPPSDATNSKNTNKPKKRGIAEYFSKTPKKKQIESEIQPKTTQSDEKKETNLLYKIQLDDDDDNTYYYCQLKEIRPRARMVLEIKDLKIGQKVMLNYNTEDPLEKGYWYDFKIEEIKKLRTSHELLGTIYLGPEGIPQNDTKVRVLDKVFAIEEVVPLADRSLDQKNTMATQPDKRALPLNCLTCRDDEDAPCKDCGCFLCSGKEFPEKIVLCDECNKGYHMICLTPALVALPAEEWYCPACRRDASAVVAPGAAPQPRRAAKHTKRDWGRGMACVGKTKTCSMPPNHFGPIPGIEVGMCWRFRIQLSESGVHRPPVSGIHGRDVEGAYSIVLSGGYEDDVDHGVEFTYTGSGGRDLSGNKRTAEQSCDQTLTRENKALARNCAVKKIGEEGGDAGAAWRDGRPVRVVRSYKMLKHFPKYAPKEGIRYDGIYKVVKFYPERGLSGFRVWKYLLRRDDASPAPWEPEAKQFPIVYPDGYLEAEAEKQALKAKNGKGQKNLKGTKGGKKRALRDRSTSSEDDDGAPPGKRRKNIFATKTVKVAKNDAQKPAKEKPQGLNDDEREAIKADELNVKLWDECLLVADTRGKKEFVEYVSQMFLCIICQELAAAPVTTPCLHNFCGACMKLALKASGAQCPCCRAPLPAAPPPNAPLQRALRAVMPGYDAGKK